MKFLSYGLYLALCLLSLSCERYNVSVEELCVTQAGVTVPGVSANGGMVEINKPLRFNATDLDLSDILSKISDPGTLTGKIVLNHLIITPDSESGVSNLNFVKTLTVDAASGVNNQLPVVSIANYTAAVNPNAMSIDLVGDANGNLFPYLILGKTNLSFSFSGTLPTMDWKTSLKICLAVEISGQKSLLNIGK